MPVIDCLLPNAQPPYGLSAVDEKAMGSQVLELLAQVESRVDVALRLDLVP